jgi:hypothetical protein
MPAKKPKRPAKSASHKTGGSKPREGKRLQMPPLMVELAGWLEKHDDHAVGFWELAEGTPGEGHFQDDAAAARLAAHALLFARTGDGSEVVVVERGGGLPQAIVYLDSEGGETTIATSPEQFLLALAEADTGVTDLDDEDATERPAFAAWVAKRKLEPPKAPGFDLGAFLEGKEQTAAAKPEPAAGPPPADSRRYESMAPRTRRLALLIGRRADDPELMAFVTDELKKKVPASLSWSKDYQWVEADKKHGINLLFESHVLHDAYPEIPKSKTSFIPYLANIYFSAAYPDPLPFGVRYDADVATLQKSLGAPAGTRSEENHHPYWHVMIDEPRGLMFTADYYDGSPRMSLGIDSARALSTAAHSKPMVGLFVAWAVARGLLEVARFPAHATLIAQIAARQAQGSTLVDAALARGLWDRHLLDRAGLHDFAYGWFHNIGGKYIRFDLIKVFGGRPGAHGHEEPILDDDRWAAVDRATPMLDRVFAKWVGKT